MEGAVGGGQGGHELLLLGQGGDLLGNPGHLLPHSFCLGQVGLIGGVCGQGLLGLLAALGRAGLKALSYVVHQFTPKSHLRTPSPVSADILP